MKNTRELQIIHIFVGVFIWIWLQQKITDLNTKDGRESYGEGYSQEVNDEDV